MRHVSEQNCKRHETTTNTHLLTTLKIDAAAAGTSGTSDNVACDEPSADWAVRALAWAERRSQLHG